MYSKRIGSFWPILMGPAFYAGYVLGKQGKPHEPKFNQRVLLIDWDNCLCDTMPRIIIRMHLVFNELKLRHPNLEIDQETLSQPMTGELSEHMRNTFGEAYGLEAKNLYMEYMNHPTIPPKRPFPGAAEFLQTLLDREVPFAIISNGTTAFVQSGIDEFGWGKMLSEVPVITVDVVKKNNKPNPMHFLAALDSLKINIKDKHEREIIVVGDGADSDMLGSLKLAEKLKLPNVKISAYWINHGASLSSQLKTVTSFQELQEQIFPEDSSLVRKFF